MRKGFINILLIGVMAAVSVLASALYVKYEVNKIEQKTNLGATVFTTQLTDTINTFRNQVNSSTANLNTQLTTGIESSFVSGTIGVNKGGFGTSSLQLNAFLLGNGTSSPQYLAAVQSGQLAISSGTTWVAASLSAGTSTVITTSTGSITIGSNLSLVLASAVVSSTTNFSTSSVSFSTIGTSTTNGIASSTITFNAAHRAMIIFTGSWENSGTNSNYLTFTVDGVDVSVNGDGIVQSGGSTSRFNATTVFITESLTAASHTFRARIRTSGGTITVGGGVNGLWEFSVLEISN